MYATNANPDEQLGSIKSFAKDLVLALAFHLAERIASLLRQVLDHPTKVLYDPETEVLFLPQFWLFPIYRELLNTASRNRPSKNSEVRRAASGLVKVLCTAQDCSAGKKGSRKGKPLKQGGALAKFNDWFGSMSLMNTLYVWFPASWGPSVVEAISKRNQRWLQQHPVDRGTRYRSGMSTPKRCTQSWWLMHGLIGCIWMTLTSLNSLRYYVRESSGMSSRNVRRKECGSRHSCCLVWAARRMNSWTSCSVNGNSGL